MCYLDVGTLAGPKKVVTKQAQGYRLERRPVRPEGLSPPLDRLLVFQVRAVAITVGLEITATL